jgi:hypothetical protein
MHVIHYENTADEDFGDDGSVSLFVELPKGRPLNLTLRAHH